MQSLQRMTGIATARKQLPRAPGSKELEQFAPFRPRMENVKDAVPGITFSNYYFDTEKGNYYVEVYANGEAISRLELGTQLPIDSIIRTRRMDLGDLLWDAGKFGLSFFTQFSTWASFGLQYKYGDDTLMSAPFMENLAELLDHPEPKYDYYPGNIVVDIYTPLPTSSRTKNTPPISGYKLRDKIIIGKNTGRR